VRRLARNRPLAVRARRLWVAALLLRLSGLSGSIDSIPRTGSGEAVDLVMATARSVHIVLGGIRGCFGKFLATWT
jgi:hypothetical protein